MRRRFLDGRPGHRFIAGMRSMVLRSTSGFTEDSAKIARTCSRRIVAMRSSTSPADGWASVEREGMTAPTTRSP